MEINAVLDYLKKYRGLEFYNADWGDTSYYESGVILNPHDKFPTDRLQHFSDGFGCIFRFNIDHKGNSIQMQKEQSYNPRIFRIYDWRSVNSEVLVHDKAGCHSFRYTLYGFDDDGRMRYFRDIMNGNDLPFLYLCSLFWQDGREIGSSVIDEYRNKKQNNLLGSYPLPEIYPLDFPVELMKENVLSIGVFKDGYWVMIKINGELIKIEHRSRLELIPECYAWQSESLPKFNMLFEKLKNEDVVEEKDRAGLLRVFNGRM